MSCHYDCSEDRTLAAIPEYADIAGIGVVIGYTATAGVTVCIITGYYFLAHDARSDPFHKEGSDKRLFLTHRAQPVDDVVLRCSSAIWQKIRRKLPLANPTVVATVEDGRLEKALLKCVLTLSDLQILTGLSILISGYTQLRCGLSVYHWQILVYLTWFCSLTHLSCLTFSRNYLYNHPGERLWRLLGMGVLVIMLIVALLPTGNFTNDMDPAEYAICTFRQLAPKKQGGLDYVSMIISVLLMGLGFVSRFIRLHKSLAVGILKAGRQYLSERARSYLRKAYKKCKTPLQPASQDLSRSLRVLRSPDLKLMLIYRPMLAIFLIIRVVLNLWTSLILEVWWLLVSFAWGVNSLVLSMKSESKEAPDPKNWTFGQIAPVILLLAPLLMVIELLCEPNRKKEDNNSTMNATERPTRTETVELIARMDAASTADLQDDPDHDFYQELWFQSFTLYMLVVIVYFSVSILFPKLKSSKGQYLNFFVPSGNILEWLPVAFVMGAINFILFSLSAKSLQKRQKLWQVLIWISSFSVYVLCWWYTTLGYNIGFAVLGFLYITSSFVKARAAQHITPSVAPASN